jgi:hypothetical protein
MIKGLQVFAGLFCVIGFSSCSTSSLKENINKTGDVAGQAIGQFASGVTTGVKKSIEPKIDISDNVKNKGLSFGKMTILSDSAATANTLVAYIIFNNDFTGTLTALAFDNKNLEMGRVKVEIKGRKDESRYIEFHFDKRCELKNDCCLRLE